ncbi:DMT family transporter [Accumulibacter sp.]|uniref:DMT family transporter n=1 Tax=Accumulibacter sp. TaxID=2053492 RepID=UPI0025F82299|nr:DMT family transporter [Accumulibacter sp.]MCM8613506.1 DMT family transporter [Accumulibacter sp.]MCM8637179.1 DMT family transporter [Accumulibacter sp.]MCM8640757.1 DMT family transporter [Accumulibacter sp.]
MSHARAVSLMILVTLLWSIAGVVARHLDSVHSFEVTFWRSLFNALALGCALSLLRGRRLWRSLVDGGWPLWCSGVCWAVMFTAFMLAITLTSVANVLVAMAIGPLITALFARLFLQHRLPARTWLAIAAAGAGIAWMFGQEAGTGLSLTGSIVALAVPVAAALNFTTLQHVGHRRRSEDAAVPQDMLPAVFIGAVLSAACTLPLAHPLQATPHDLALLALLGVVQLAIPCLLVVRLSRELAAPEIALLGLLEVVFGVTWAWLGAGEQPSGSTLTGGALVLAALVGNEVLALRGLAGNAPPRFAGGSPAARRDGTGIRFPAAGDRHL